MKRNNSIYVYVRRSDWRKYLHIKDPRKFVDGCYFKTYSDIRRFLIKNDLYAQAGNCTDERCARSTKYIAKDFKRSGGINVQDINFVFYGRIYSLDKFEKGA